MLVGLGPTANQDVRGRAGAAPICSATESACWAIVRSRPPAWRRSKPTKKTPSSAPVPASCVGRPLSSTGTVLSGNSAATPAR